MTLQHYEGICTWCDDRITWIPVDSPNTSGRPSYRFTHAGSLEPIYGNAELNLDVVSARLHERMEADDCTPDEIAAVMTFARGVFVEGAAVGGWNAC